MNDITFIIHLRKDTVERSKNVDIVLSYYKSIIPTAKFIVVEDDRVSNFRFLESDKAIKYIHFYNIGQHNKCKGYNIGLDNCDTEIICFLDIDCIVSKQNIEKSIETLKQTESICIGYNGVAIYFNYDVKNSITNQSDLLYDFLETFVDKSNLYNNYTNEFYHVANIKAVGGVLLGYKSTFKKIGGFNPNFKGWGYEDNEIIIRSKKLNVPIFAINTFKPYLFHLPHISNADKNTESNHISYNLNREEFIRISNYTQTELIEYIESWR
jgi:predicted glycosyltransferase involved in capsule biosynthesis